VSASQIKPVDLTTLSLSDTKPPGLQQKSEGAILNSLMSQLNWDSESFVPTEQEKLKIGIPVTRSMNLPRLGGDPIISPSEINSYINKQEIEAL